jgi:hypothetical protein
MIRIYAQTYLQMLWLAFRPKASLLEGSAGAFAASRARGTVEPSCCLQQGLMLCQQAH